MRDLLDRLHSSLNIYKTQMIDDEDIHFLMDWIEEDWKAERQKFYYWMIIICMLSITIGIILGKVL